MIVWPTVENAIHSWVTSASGVPAVNVVWSQEGIVRPPERPFIELRVVSLASPGRDAKVLENNPLVLSDDDVESVSAGTDELTLTAHAYLNGDGPVRLVTTGTLPAGLALATDYWVIVIDANTIQLASTFQNAMAAVPVPVDVTDAGTGTHTIEDTAETVRAGIECLEKAQGMRVLTLQFTAFGEPPPAAFATTPLQILDAVLNQVELDTVWGALDTAGFGFGNSDPIITVDGNLHPSVLEPRAIVVCRGFLGSEVQVPTTYIEKTNPITFNIS